ncbi:protein kinase domain-containing protein, partial [Haematococcus lacustris]
MAKHAAGVLRLNGLGAAVFPVQSILRSGSTVGMNDLRPSPFEAPSSRRVLAMDQTTKAEISTVMALQRDTVITGNPYQPQALLLDLAAAPTRLGLTLPGGQLTLSNLVLGNAAPLLSSLVCGAAAQQQGVACNPASLNSTADPDASSRAVWRATRLGDLGAEGPLTPLCSPALADALGGLTSLLWFFHSPRASPLAGQPPLASAPLVLLNVTILLPDLEAQAIREVAAGGSTRVNLRPDTLELLRAQLAGQQAFCNGPASMSHVAVKRLLFSGLTHQPDFRAQRQQVLMEAELNAGLAHPNLVATYAYCFAPLTHSNEVATDWVLLLVCELCSCGSLSNAIVNGRLWDSQLQEPRVPQVLTVLSDVAHGMAYLHSRNIMHRDLKPDNVLLQDSPEGVVAKVADLGLGDVYSFGVLAWELLHGLTVWARLQQITQEPRYLQCLVPHPNLFDHDWRPQPAGPAAAPQ